MRAYSDILQADTSLSAFASGGTASQAIASATSSASPATTLTTTEAQLGSVSITPRSTSAKILVIARVDVTKDTGTTVRTSTLRVRRGTTNSDTQVGVDSIVRSQGVASSAYGPATVVAVDSPAVTTSVTYSIRGLVDAATASTAARVEITAVELWEVSGSGREKLSANRTYYVRTDGNDSNTGLANTSGGAFLTLQGAMNYVASNIDLGGFVVTIQIADGTYTAGVTVKSCVGQAGPTSLLFIGNTTTPANVIISAPTDTSCFVSSVGTGCEVRGMSLTAAGSSSNSCGLNITGGTIHIGTGMRFGSCGYAHVSTLGPTAQAVHSYGYTITAGAQYHWACDVGGTVQFFPDVFGLSAQVVTLSGTPALSQQFAYVGLGSKLVVASYSSMVTFSGSATGKRYVIEMNGAVQVYGASTTYFPGSIAGTTATGGQYA